jgi:L-lysine exporter family protein LysE/ArgO
MLPLHSWLALAQGFLLCAGLIIAIGPQNLFILQQGLRGRHLLLTALLCTLFDLLLIGLGVGGVGTALAADARVLTVTTLGGATFLLGYGVRALHAAWYSPAVADDNSCQMRGASAALSVKGTVLATLSFSFLNPAAYLDTMLMIGTTSSRYPIDERLYFGTGAVLASALWFFTLTYGASRLTPLFRHRAAWRTLDVVSGCIMVGLAAALSATQSFWFW